MAQDDNSHRFPLWLQELQSRNVGLIDSVVGYPADATAPDYRSYMIYYNQPLLHANPEDNRFHMRALVTVNIQNDITTAVNHVYFSGYSLSSEYLAKPDSVFRHVINRKNEIAHRYNANFIQLEHRYFQYSAPDECWTYLDPLTTEEAAADFHNLITAMKKVLKGKWALSGVSKGGITTLLQHTFYPEDADIFVPYSAPFFVSDRDTAMQTYWYSSGLTKEYNDFFMTLRKAGLDENPDQTKATNPIWSIYAKMSAVRNTPQHMDSVFGRYLNTVAEVGFMEHAYEDSASIRAMLVKNDSILRAHHWTGYNDTAIAYIYWADGIRLDGIDEWLDALRNKRHPNTPMRHSHMPFGVTEKEWWGQDKEHPELGSAYEYQSKRELGYYDHRFNLIAATTEAADAYNAYWKEKVGCARNISEPYFADLPFSPNLYNSAMETTRNASKPIVLLYGQDDTWTGAAVKDEFVNGTNVRKFILPEQNHWLRFNSDTDLTQCNAIRDILDEVLGSPQRIAPVCNQPEQNGVSTRKMLRNGQLYLNYNGHIYDVRGTRLQ